MVALPRLVAGAALLAALALALFPPAALAGPPARGMALCVAAIGLLATGVLPEFITAILFFLAGMLLAVAPAEVVFAGFHSTAFWLVFGGLVIGVGVRRTGLAERLAGSVAAHFGASYLAVIGGTVAIGVALAFLMPSTMGRTLILIPIILALADRLGFAEGSNGRTAMVLAVAFGTMVPAFSILPATVPAMVLIGASETLYGLTPVYGSYLLLHFPVLGLLKAAAIAALLVVMFPDRPVPGAGQNAAPAGPMGQDERRMALLLGLALALWVTDFAHHVSPAWVALGVAAACLLPSLALVPAQAFNERVNFGSLFYIAGVLGIGALVAHSGGADLLAGAALGLLDLAPGDDLRTFAAVGGLSSLVAMVATQPGVPAVMTPLAGSIAEAAGLPVQAVLMMQVVGFSTVILPYQTPPLVVAMQLGNVPMRVGSRFCLALLAVTVALLVPLDYLWWRLLGWVG